MGVSAYPLGGPAQSLGTTHRPVFPIPLHRLRISDKFVASRGAGTLIAKPLCNASTHGPRRKAHARLQSDNPRDSAMQSDGKATRIDLFSLATPNMRAFHMSW